DGGSYKDYEGGNADHGDIFDSQNLCNYLTANDVSEVWLWGGAGMYQSFGFDSFAYRFTGDVLPNRAPTDADRELYARRRKNLPECGRSVWVLGFTYPGYGYDPRLYTMRIEEILNLS